MALNAAGYFILTDRHRNPNAHSLNEVSCACFFVAALTATRFEVSDCIITVSEPPDEPRHRHGHSGCAILGLLHLVALNAAGYFILTDRHRNPNAHSLNEVSCACFFVAALTATRFEVSDCTTTVSVPVAWLVWRLPLNLSGHCLSGLGNKRKVSGDKELVVRSF